MLQSRTATTLGTLSIADDTMQALAAHDWPGNVRELRNVLERAIYMRTRRGRQRARTDLAPDRPASATRRIARFEPRPKLPRDAQRFDADFERRYVKWLLGRHNGNVSAAAREAKMDRKHLHDLAKKHGMRNKDDDAGDEPLRGEVAGRRATS